MKKCAVAPREQLLARRSVGTAQLQGDPAAGFPRTCNNACAGGRYQRSRDRHVAEFLVLPGDVRTLGLPVQARTGDAAGEMAPIRRLQRTRIRMRAWRNHISTGLDQLAPGGEYMLPTGWRSRLDDHECIDGQSPKPLHDPWPIFRSKLVQNIGQGDQIARFAIDFVHGNIGSAPGHVRLPHLRRELLAERAENRAGFHEQYVGEPRPAFRRRPKRGARTGANVERTLRGKIRAGFSDRGEARAHRRIGRRQTHREIG